MLATLMAALLLGSGTYQTKSGSEASTIKEHGSSLQCHRLEPQETFQIQGPAKGAILLRVDAKKKRKPKPVVLTIDLDGVKKRHRLKPKRGKRVTYDPPVKVVPSRALEPIPLLAAEGEHSLVLSLPGKRSGCVVLDGLTLAAPEPVAVAAPPEPPEAAEAAEPPKPSEPEPATEPSGPEPSGPEPAAATELALVSPATGEVVEEIRAVSVPEPSTESVKEEVAAVETLSQDLLRIGPKAGGNLPRGDLKPGFSVVLLVDLPLSTLGMPAGVSLAGLSLDFSAYLEAGWSPMRQQDRVMLEGRGEGTLIQNSLVLPFELGARVRIGFGAPILLYAGVGLALDVSRTELEVFSTPAVHENDVAVGVATMLGIALPLGPGDLLFEIRYRETRANLGEMADVAEPTFANAAAHLGYVFAIGR